MTETSVKLTEKGGVKGGHWVLYAPERDPFVPPMRECHSVALRPDDRVVDIGAYCGTYSLWAARQGVSHVVAYEPTRSTFEVLVRNVDRLKLGGKISLRRAAVVGNGAREVELNIARGLGVTNSVVPKRGKAGIVVVPAVSYDEAVIGATVVKIDVEGAEHDYPRLARDGIRALIIDFHKRTDLDWLASCDAIVADVEACGFKPIISPDWSNGWTMAGSWVRG